jgi:hypothetical protein
MTKLKFTPIGKTMRIRYDLPAIEDAIAAEIATKCKDLPDFEYTVLASFRAEYLEVLLIVIFRLGDSLLEVSNTIELSDLESKLDATIAAIVKSVHRAVSKADVAAETYLENGGAT